MEHVLIDLELNRTQKKLKNPYEIEISQQKFIEYKYMNQ